jgi:DNA-directed RNA polymerase sigma subunit (sigma70/sigma32)
MIAAIKKGPAMTANLDNDAWLGILSEVFQVDVAEKIDSIDIVWSDLNFALEGMDARQVFALQARYGDKLTLKGVGRVIGRKDGSGPLTQECVRQVIKRAIRMLRHPNRLRVLRSSILAAWNLNA